GYIQAKALREKLVVLYGANVQLPPPLENLPAENKVKIDRTCREGIELLLKRIYIDLPKNLFEESINDTLINGRDKAPLDAPVDTFLEVGGVCRSAKSLMRDLQIKVALQDMEAVRRATRDGIPPSSVVSGDTNALMLFGLAQQDAGYSWDEFYARLR